MVEETLLERFEPMHSTRTIVSHHFTVHHSPMFFNFTPNGSNRIWLVVYLPLWKIWKSVGIMTFPIYRKIKHVPNHQPGMIQWKYFENPSESIYKNASWHRFLDVSGHIVPWPAQKKNASPRCFPSTTGPMWNHPTGLKKSNLGWWLKGQGPI